MILNYKEFYPEIHTKAWIAPSADVIGRVKLAEDVSVWFGCVIRADVNEVIIGKNSNIQDLSCIHTDKDSKTIIGENVTVGHKVILHGCKIEDNCLIGMGATILDNAVIGEGSIVGANSLVTYGKVFPPKSLIMGSPAKVVRELSDDEVKGLKEHALHYVEYKNDYKYI
ncbi:gamma carbonic anhydrase family protein [Aliarcobacter thereius]|uniref:2,3,4,5-tetrahydropyridine-2,6-dicarboxylate N-acetyltransferase n=2 Tax=Aliarcobacter thereius TaxID=544718 RepID=A0A1C0B5Z7_9BACT|nr:gamma carbonic anhydrase family protein [Aliarcobacter thereius]OCL90390.1 2,3,4,5-tetrahydropyridine-2,6-dicarboxylate N-acetyltransferase [Aliarcobacter thereius]OCL95855.1 2,3,4,5-tetrahydropyridine-2,6-dicarboxylate N-acetyltransferase [Aliarcobacter thereius LMG 24486]OCL98424.1 2,3,4,5-tetrahydropyridine-2,6-dicarboxylate N-acetyltransferase [Aliarcobacter thereius]QBF16172.1 gamma carbonic anhydrase family protein [Aliarcobacter thereius LMG 24486]TLS92200.1 gamma carbonic anhydrase 